MNFLSREVVFLFPSDHLELENFLKSIFHTSSKGVSFHNFSTNVLASINIEVSGQLCNNLNSFIFKYEGDRVHPFLDLLNTLTKISDFHELNARFEYDFGLKNSIFSPVSQAIMRQFIGHLNSGHSSLLRYVFEYKKFYFIIF